MAKLKTGRHTSALKQIRQSDKRNSRNSGLKKKVKEVVKEFLISLDGTDVKKSEKLLAEVYSRWDKAAKSGAIHKKTASRKKAQFAKKLTVKKKSA
ncbi:MAG TPA: 30S ribosomal protein S20 [Elusimicrobiales bacterium]|nr:30S ribosomal protein S20 [Elusimicrobiales bacterium]